MRAGLFLALRLVPLAGLFLLWQHGWISEAAMWMAYALAYLASLVLLGW